MTLDLGLFTLLHVLVFVYWLGGDLGAFFSSYTLIDAKKPVAVRMFALHVVNNVDMAPKSSLILTLPTGLTLAVAKGWMSLPLPLLVGVWTLAAVWLFLVWRIHLKHLPTTARERRFDIAIRWVLVAALLGTSIANLTGLITVMPLFIAIKCIFLATSMLAGLIVRRALGPLFVAVREMAANGPTTENDRIIRNVIMRRSKPTVVSIWLMVTMAALCGLVTPL